MNRREYMREYMRRRRAAGLCASCGLESEQGYSRCEICRMKSRMSDKARRPRKCRSYGVDLTGQVFSRLRVIKREGYKGRNYAWLCLCQCGTYKVIAGQSLRQGNTRSCGCLQREKARRTQIQKMSAVDADLYFERREGDK